MPVPDVAKLAAAHATELILRLGKGMLGLDRLAIARNVIIDGRRGLAVTTYVGLIADQQRAVALHDRAAGS